MGNRDGAIWGISLERGESCAGAIVGLLRGDAGDDGDNGLVEKNTEKDKSTGFVGDKPANTDLQGLKKE